MLIGKKNGVNHYGYKSNIRIDIDHDLIRRYIVTPANIHDSQMLICALDPENRDDFVWADSDYAGEIFEQLLELEGYECHISEKGKRNHLLCEQATKRNGPRSKVRA